MKLSKIQLAIYMNKYGSAFHTLQMAGSAGDAYEQKIVADSASRELARLRKELWELINS